MLTDEQIKNNSDLIISLLRSTKRDGMENVIRYLQQSGFFIVPSSVNRHHNWKGGLAEHSLGVYRLAVNNGKDVSQESIIIAGLLHDICKASKLYYDEKGVVHYRHCHIEGHGYRSVKLLEKCGLKFSVEEKLAIRWHMGGHHASESEQEEVFITRQNRLWKIIHEADHLDASRKIACMINRNQ